MDINKKIDHVYFEIMDEMKLETQIVFEEFKKQSELLAKNQLNFENFQNLR